MPVASFRELRAERLRDETGTLFKQAEFGVALVYPSPYRVGMSSLGFQTIYRELNGLPGVVAERAFLPDDAETALAAREGLATYESARPVADFAVLAFSLAYELELLGLVQCLDLAGLPRFSEERLPAGRRFPLVVIGGPLTFSNPVPAAPYADVILMGEAEEAVKELVEAVRAHASRDDLLADLSRRPGFYVPRVHGEVPPPILAAPTDRLPARSQIRTPHTELANMFLVEPERGCHRGCTYCVMRRSTNGGMRLVPAAKVLSLVPADAPRVGLVGAAVTDHPELPVILRALVEQGREVGISSLRADRLNDEIVGLLRRGGYRTLTTASDGSSERLRDQIQRKTKERHLLKVAELCRAHRFATLKIYMMIGLPGETLDDIEELGRFAGELLRVVPRLAFGIAPFVAKRNTPLDGAPFEEIAVLEERLARLRALTKGRVDLRATSPKWAWVEYRLAQGGAAAGRAVAEVAGTAGRFGDWRRALAGVPAPPVASPPPTAPVGGKAERQGAALPILTG